MHQRATRLHRATVSVFFVTASAASQPRRASSSKSARSRIAVPRAWDWKSNPTPFTVRQHHRRRVSSGAGRRRGSAGHRVGDVVGRRRHLDARLHLPRHHEAQSPNRRYGAADRPGGRVRRQARRLPDKVAWLPSPIRDHRGGAHVGRFPDGIQLAQSGRHRAAAAQSADKNWVACDNTPTGPAFFRPLLRRTDEPAGGDLSIMMSKSTDGGATWTRPFNTANFDAGLQRRTSGQAEQQGHRADRNGNGIIIFVQRWRPRRGPARSTSPPIFWGGDGAASGQTNAPSTAIDGRWAHRHACQEDCRFLPGAARTTSSTTSLGERELVGRSSKRVPMENAQSSVG